MDLDQDGWPDIISGSRSGAIFIFRGQGPGQFGPREPIMDRQGKPLRIPFATMVFAADWRGTGKLDLLVGTHAGHIYLIPNEAGDKGYAFGQAYRLSANGQEIHLQAGYACPVAADWDLDGKLDLLVGTAAGSVLWYRNIGSRSEPELSAPRILVPESPFARDVEAAVGPNQTGTHAKICVTDWNGDGWPDLIVADDLPLLGPKPKQTEGEKIAEAQARRRLSVLYPERERLQQTIRSLTVSASEATGEIKKEREMQAQNLRRRLCDVANEIADLQEVIGPFRPRVYHHGYIWLFLRNPPRAPAQPAAGASR